MTSPPALWNPNAAACWSVLFSPAFGAWLHARNAERMNRPAEVRANGIWFRASLAYFVLVLVSPVVPAIPDVFYRITGIGLLLGWYFVSGRKQIEYVNQTWQGEYPRRAWAKPLLIAFGCLLGLMVLISVLTAIARLH